MKLYMKNSKKLAEKFTNNKSSMNSFGSSSKDFYDKEVNMFDKVVKSFAYREKMARCGDTSLHNTKHLTANLKLFNPVDIRENVIENSKRRNEKHMSAVNAELLTRKLKKKYLSNIVKANPPITVEGKHQQCPSYTQSDEKEEQLFKAKLSSNPQKIMRRNSPNCFKLITSSTFAKTFYSTITASEDANEYFNDKLIASKGHLSKFTNSIANSTSLANTSTLKNKAQSKKVPLFEIPSLILNRENSKIKITDEHFNSYSPLETLEQVSSQRKDSNNGVLIPSSIAQNERIPHFLPLQRRTSILEKILKRKSTLTEEMLNSPDEQLSEQQKDLVFFHRLSQGPISLEDEPGISIKNENSQSQQKKNKTTGKGGKINFQAIKAQLKDSKIQIDNQMNLALIKSRRDGIIPIFGSSIALNNYIIRDFVIGESTDHTVAEKKLKIATKSFANILKKKKKKARENNTSKTQTKEQRDCAGAEEIDEKELKEIKEEQRRKSQKKRKEKEKAIIKVLDSISRDGGNNTLDNNHVSLVDEQRLFRVMRIRRVIQGNLSDEHEDYGRDNINKYKDEMRRNDNELITALSKLGPPLYLKNRFKKSTINKFNIVNGKYFGVLV